MRFICSFLFFHLSLLSSSRKERTGMGSNIETRVFARLFGLAVLTLLALAALFAGSLQAQAGIPASVPAAGTSGKINSQVLKDTANGRKTSFVIFLAEQANLTQAYS